MTICTAIVLLAAQGCSEQKKAELGPEQTVETFCRAVAGGDFETATSLCDISSMKEYIEEYEQAWSMLQKKDGGIFEIAAEMLADAEFTVEDMIKEGERRHIFFRLNFKGEEKKKLAIIRKEEGAWKVEAIIDRS